MYFTKQTAGVLYCGCVWLNLSGYFMWLKLHLYTLAEQPLLAASLFLESTGQQNNIEHRDWITEVELTGWFFLYLICKLCSICWEHLLLINASHVQFRAPGHVKKWLKSMQNIQYVDDVSGTANWLLCILRTKSQIFNQLTETWVLLGFPSYLAKSKRVLCD